MLFKVIKCKNFYPLFYNYGLLLSENNNAGKSEIKDVGFSENKNVGISENNDACFGLGGTSQSVSLSR